MGRLNRLRDFIYNPTFFSMQMFANMMIGGFLAAFLMKPWLEAGPIRIATYLILGLGATILAYRYIKLARASEDGKATLLVVASCWTWLAFSATGYSVTYLLIAGAYELWPNWGESLTERIIYFFVSGTAIGVGYKAWIFFNLADDELIDRRVWAWPFTIGVRRRRRDA